MNAISTAALWLVRVSGAAQVTLGLLFWTHRALTLVSVHMIIGLAFVAGVWVLAGVAAWAGAGAGPALFGAVWGIAVLVLGMTQRTLLPGRAHWLIQVLHLALGLGAMVLANWLAARTRTRRNSSLSSYPQPAASNDGSLTAS